MYIENTTTKKKELLSTIKVNPNSPTSVFFVLGNNEEPVSLDGKIKLLFSLQASIEGNSSLVTFVKESYNNSGSVLKVEWETGGVVNYGWNKTIAKTSFV